MLDQAQRILKDVFGYDAFAATRARSSSVWAVAAMRWY